MYLGLGNSVVGTALLQDSRLLLTDTSDGQLFSCCDIAQCPLEDKNFNSAVSSESVFFETLVLEVL